MIICTNIESCAVLDTVLDEICAPISFTREVMSLYLNDSFINPVTNDYVYRAG